MIVSSFRFQVSSPQSKYEGQKRKFIVFSYYRLQAFDFILKLET